MYRTNSLRICQKSSTKIVCSDYPVKIENKATHIRIENSNGETHCLKVDKSNICIAIEKDATTTYIEKDILISQIWIPSTNDEASIIFLNCDKIIMKNASFIFNLYFIPLKSNIFSE